MVNKNPNYSNEYYGMSTDTKPTDALNASRFYEIDTSDVYMFDEEGKQWFKQNSNASSESGNSGEGSGSGSSSESAANVMIVKPVERHRSVSLSSIGSGGHNNVLNVTRSVIYDKTWQEVHDALAAGTQVFVNADFLVENTVELGFAVDGSNDIDDLYARLFNDILYKQVLNNEQSAALGSVTSAFVHVFPIKETDTETGGIRYEKEYVLSPLYIYETYYDIPAIDNSSDGAIYCESGITYTTPSDYNSELDDAYDQWLNGGGPISDTPGTQEQDETGQG